jgi:uncharacterized repeat protein (TIGR03843 family)
MQSVDESLPIKAIFKPVSGLQPLWDFPKNDLIERELATFILSETANLGFVPPTVIREINNLGIGMLQLWIDDVTVEMVQIFDSNQVPDDYLLVLEASDQFGNPVSLAAQNCEWLDQLTIFDAVINNSDRKASHILSSKSGEAWAIDHGVTWHQEDKLRTVLWANAGKELTILAKQTLTSINEALTSRNKALVELLTQVEIEAAFNRIELINGTGVFPVPSGTWPAIPWPVF